MSRQRSAHSTSGSALLDITAELLALALRLPRRPLMHRAAAGDQVETP